MLWEKSRLDAVIDNEDFVQCTTRNEARSFRAALRRRLRARDLAETITTEVRERSVWLHRRPTIILSSELT